MLPPVNVWARVVDQASFLTASLRVVVKKKGLFFDKLLASGFYTCVLNRRGYLVIYTEHLLGHNGYAVNLRKATKLVIKFAQAASNGGRFSKRPTIVPGVRNFEILDFTKLQF